MFTVQIHLFTPAHTPCTKRFKEYRPVVCIHDIYSQNIRIAVFSMHDDCACFCGSHYDPSKNKYSTTNERIPICYYVLES